MPGGDDAFSGRISSCFAATAEGLGPSFSRPSSRSGDCVPDHIKSVQHCSKKYELLPVFAIDILPKPVGKCGFYSPTNVRFDFPPATALLQDACQNSPVTPADIPVSRFPQETKHNPTASPLEFSSSGSIPSEPQATISSPPKSSPPTSLYGGSSDSIRGDSKTAIAANSPAARQSENEIFADRHELYKDTLNTDSVDTHEARSGITTRKRPRSKLYIKSPSESASALRSFFAKPVTTIAATRASISASHAGQHLKRPRYDLAGELRDPWCCGSLATCHVNPPRLRTRVDLAPRGKESLTRTTISVLQLSPSWVPTSRICSFSTKQHMTRRDLFEDQDRSLRPQDCYTLMVDKCLEESYQAHAKLHSSQLDELTAWLSSFYTDRIFSPSRMTDFHKMSQVFNNSTADEEYEFLSDSANSERSSRDSCQGQRVENVVLLTGDVGSGKSSIIFQAAERLSLTLLEINTSTCRTGKRVRDIIGDAVSSHRVSSISRKVQTCGSRTQNAGCNTLVVFEDVDTVFSDERGFWSCIYDLANIAGRRRPLVFTASKLTAEMRTLFGDVRTHVDKQLLHVLSGADLSHSSWTGQHSDLVLDNLKHIHIPCPSPPKIQSVLKGLAKAESIPKSSSDLRALTGAFACGDLRGAINAMQFWGLPISSLISERSCDIIGGGFVDKRNTVEPSIDSFTRLQEAIWTGGCERDNDQCCTSLMSARFRACSNVGRLRRYCNIAEAAPTTAYVTVASWADHLDAISLANGISASSRDLDLQCDIRHSDDSTGIEAGFAGPLGSLQVATAYEFQSAVALQGIVDCAIPSSETDSDSIVWRVRYTISSLTSPAGGREIGKFSNCLPPASAKRPFLTDILPMFSCFAMRDTELSAREPAEDIIVGSSQMTRSTRALNARRHFCSLGLHENSVASLCSLAISSKRGP